jgi:RNAse (barnase) inhibitor barstar
LRGVRTNIVQSIRAFRVHDLQETARAAGPAFPVRQPGPRPDQAGRAGLIAAQFTFPAHFGKNFDALYDCMTDPLHKSGPQPGFIVVLEQIPATAKFDKEAREQLLDIFRDRRLLERPQDTLPVLLFFSVARSAPAGQAERANEAQGATCPGHAH